MILPAIIIVVLFIILIIFSFPQFSPIPYFPSNIKDIKLILKALNLKNDQTIVDLGAGGGLVIFEAAEKTYEQKLDTQFIAIELNPILILILHIKRFFHKNGKNIKIIYGDMFKMKSVIRNSQLSNGTIVFYLYISPWFLNKVINQIKKTIKKFTVVSYFYEIKGEKYIKKSEGKHNVYVYKFD